MPTPPDASRRADQGTAERPPSPAPRPALTARQRFDRAREDALGSVVVCLLFLFFALRVSFVPLLAWLSVGAAVLVLVAPFRHGLRQLRRGELAGLRTLAILCIPAVVVFLVLRARG